MSPQVLRIAAPIPIMSSQRDVGIGLGISMVMSPPSTSVSPKDPSPFRRIPNGLPSSPSPRIRQMNECANCRSPTLVRSNSTSTSSFTSSSYSSTSSTTLQNHQFSPSKHSSPMFAKISSMLHRLSSRRQSNPKKRKNPQVEYEYDEITLNDEDWFDLYNFWVKSIPQFIVDAVAPQS